ncbi:hypothetical protein FQN57_006225 [Myotisia sp. PD_48]|nr:hypothetical protein FQN57_006225 [Myotisia sp. PD_48]
MGGKIFSVPKGNQPALLTPRMSLNDYVRTRAFCISKLQQAFKEVITPPEAPGKLDFGDIDFLTQAFLPKYEWKDVGQLLQARRSSKNGDTCSFAVAIPPSTPNDDSKNDDNSETYAQVDIHICHPGFLEWECLLDSYGDMWQIVGKFLRPLGFTATDKGLHLRIEEIEPWDRTFSMVYLSHNVTDVLRFLGLDFDHFNRGFETVEELYGWCAGGKYFHLDAINTTTSNDRQRMRKRPMFRNFIDIWAVQNSHIWRDKVLPQRSEVARDALVHFGKQTEYDEKITVWGLAKEEEKLWGEVASVIPVQSPTSLRLVLRGLKRWVGFTANVENSPVKPILRTEPEMELDHQPRWASQIRAEEENSLSKDVLFEWVLEHWMEVKAMEKARVATAKAARR